MFRLLPAVIISLVFVLFAAPFNFGFGSAYFYATSIAIALALWIVITLRHRILADTPTMVWMGGLVIFAGFNAWATSTDIGDFATTLRYTAVTPLCFLVVGYYLNQRSADQALLALVPGAVTNIVVMFLAFKTPFVGQLRPGVWVGERSRFYIHPISQEIVFPVSIAEGCAAAFAMLWFLFAETRYSRWAIYAPLGLAAVGLSIAGATRTYLYGIVLVFAIMGYRLFVLRRKYRQLFFSGLAFGTLIVTIVVTPSLREIALVRLDRFIYGDVLESGERVEIWAERSRVAASIGAIEGTSMESYWGNYSISSHNLFLDWIIIGGWAYGLVATAGILLLGFLAFLVIVSRKYTDEEASVAAALLMMIAVVQVSSPIISSLPAYSLMWYIAGMFVAVTARYNRDRGPDVRQTNLRSRRTT